MSTTAVFGSLPKRAVPTWWATPASGIRCERNPCFGITTKSVPMSWVIFFSFSRRRLCPSSLFGVYRSSIPLCSSRTTRLSGLGRSSDVSHQSIECVAMKSSASPGAKNGAPSASISVDIGLDLRDGSPRGVGAQARHLCVSAKRHVGMLERRHHARRVRVRLGVHETREAVARAAADALARLGMLLVESDADGERERMETELLDVVHDLLDPRLMAHRRERIGLAGRVGGL